MVHNIFWYLVLQLSLAYMTGVIGPPREAKSFTTQLKCTATLLTQVTGFASVNAWGSLQQIPFFVTPTMSFLVLPISFAGQFLLQRITAYARHTTIMADSVKLKCEKLWDEHTIEAEDDIMSLTISFNLAQAIRFLNSRVLPNQEGNEAMDVLTGHTTNQILRLWAAVVFFVVLVALLYHYMPLPQEDAEESSSESEGFLRTVSHASTAESNPIYARSWKITVIACSMTFAWCAFYSAIMSLAQVRILQDEMALALALTLTISVGSFIVIRILDIIVDLEATNDRVDATLKQIIRSLGLLVGFAWEQTFDSATSVLSSGMVHTHIAKFVIAVFCVLVIVPAWYEYILPMAITRSWEWGFIVKDLDDEHEETRWLNVIEHITDSRRKARKEQDKHAAHLAMPQRRVTRGLTRSLDQLAGTLKKAKESRERPGSSSNSCNNEFDGSSPDERRADGADDGSVSELKLQNDELRGQNQELRDAFIAIEHQNKQLKDALAELMVAHVS